MILTDPRVEELKASIEPVRRQLTGHPFYARVQSPADFTLFMHYHVYAVWDFMSLLKALQRDLTCVDLPWVPKGSAGTRYLINEIVLGEESDVDQAGNRISHFELYLQAMAQAGADTAPIRALVDTLNIGAPLGDAIRLHVPEASIREFLHFTFETIASGKTHAVASVFTFGREDLIPDLFLPIIRSFPEDGDFQLFKYYLERHIEVDGDHHSHLAIAMLEELCGDDPVKWQEATEYAQGALQARIRLWDAIVAAMDTRDQAARAAAALEAERQAAEARAAEERAEQERAAVKAAEERAEQERAEAKAAEERAEQELAEARAAEERAEQELAEARAAEERTEAIAAEERAAAKAAEIARAAEAAAALETLAIGAMAPKPKKSGGRKAKAADAEKPETDDTTVPEAPLTIKKIPIVEIAPIAEAEPEAPAAVASEEPLAAKSAKEPKAPKEPRAPKEPKAAKPPKEEKPVKAPQAQQQALF